MRDLSDLIARIEAASEGSAELEREIAPRVGWQWVEEDCDLDDVICVWRGWRRPDGSKTRGLPIWTRSLDAALTLVPEGCGVELSRYWLPEPDDARWSAVLRWGLSGAYADALDKPTPSLALVAAALRARSMT